MTDDVKAGPTKTQVMFKMEEVPRHKFWRMVQRTVLGAAIMTFGWYGGFVNEPHWDMKWTIGVFILGTLVVSTQLIIRAVMAAFTPWAVYQRLKKGEDPQTVIRDQMEE